MREAAIEKAVCQWAKDHGIMVMKLAGPNQKGQPDRMFLYRGMAAFAELKATGKKPKALQKKWMSDLWDHGFVVGWFDNAPDAITWLKKIFVV
jgi:hypothetical protein